MKLLTYFFSEFIEEFKYFERNECNKLYDETEYFRDGKCVAEFYKAYSRFDDLMRIKINNSLSLSIFIYAFALFVCFHRNCEEAKKSLR